MSDDLTTRPDRLVIVNCGWCGWHYTERGKYLADLDDLLKQTLAHVEAMDHGPGIYLTDRRGG